MSPESNTMFGSFQLISRKGEGSTAEVWAAQSNLGEMKALKIFAPHFLLDDISKKMIRAEFENATKLEHPNLVVPEEYIEFGGTPAFVLPLLNRSMWQDLQERQPNGQTAPHKPYDERTLALIIVHIGGALAYLHKHNLIHNDIKPANILVNVPIEMPGTEEVHFYLTDFGISQDIRDTILRQTRSMNSLTFAYAAPEKLKGVSSGTAQSDVFSLGASLYELCFGIQQGPPLGQILNNNGHISFESPYYSRPFLHLLKKMLEKEPVARMSLGKLIDVSQAFLDTGDWPSLNNDPSSYGREELKQPEDPSTAGGANVEEIIKQYRQSGKNIDKKKAAAKRGVLIAVLTLVCILGGVLAMLTIFSDDTKWDQQIQLKNGFLLVAQEGKIGLIDTEGNVLVKPEHETGLLQDTEIVFYKDGQTIVYPLSQ